MSRKVYIYGLKEFGSDEYRYIGKTTRPNNRLKEHLNEKPRKFSYHKLNWINQCKKSKIDIVLDIIYLSDEINWEDDEKKFIEYYKKLGHRLTNLLDGGVSPQMLKYDITFDDAKKIARSLNIKTTLEWRRRCKQNEIPNTIPKRPDLYYLDNGWVSWSDWLGVEIISNKEKKFYSFNKAKKIVKNLKIRSNNEWRLYCKSDNKIKEIPSNPDITYKNDGWVSWSDWLGYEKQKTKDFSFLTYKEARNIVSKLGLKTHKDWVEYSRTSRPNNIPSNPWKIYREWEGINNFLKN